MLKGSWSVSGSSGTVSAGSGGVMGAGSSGVVPYLPLDQLNRNQGNARTGGNQ